MIKLRDFFQLLLEHGSVEWCERLNLRLVCRAAYQVIPIESIVIPDEGVRKSYWDHKHVKVKYARNAEDEQFLSRSDPVTEQLAGLNDLLGWILDKSFYSSRLSSKEIINGPFKEYFGESYIRYLFYAGFIDWCPNKEEPLLKRQRRTGNQLQWSGVISGNHKRK